MFRSRNIKIKLLTLGAIVALSAGCAASPTQSASESVSPTQTNSSTQLSLLAVPFTFALPTSALPAVEAQKLTGDYVDQLKPIAATQITYRGGDGNAAFLANAFWFDTAHLQSLLKPTEPPPGTTMATVGDRTLVVAVTVEMPYATDSADAKVYGSLSELLRDKSSYSQFDCPATADLPTRAVSTAVHDVVYAYFQGKDLLPITIDGDKETILNVQEQVAGTHSCFNPGTTGEAGYVGSVPAAATEAVMVYVKHKAYEVTGATATFVTLAKVGGSWAIVAEGTGP